MRNSRQIGEDNLCKLQNYIASLESAGKKFPSRAGNPNVSAIASACGFDRQVIYKNDKCKKLFEDSIRDIGIADINDSVAGPAFDPRDRQIRQLELRIVNLEESIAEKDRVIQDLSSYRRLYDMALHEGK
jgi:hypothetical protein